MAVDQCKSNHQRQCDCYCEKLPALAHPEIPLDSLMIAFLHHSLLSHKILVQSSCGYYIDSVLAFQSAERPGQGIRESRFHQTVLRASTIFMRAALIAGRAPPTNPIISENRSDL